MMTKSLVTGAAGFIGSHLCERLLAAGHSVMGLDSLLSGRTENLEHLAANPDFNFTSMSIQDAQWLISSSKFDYVFHLAARADIVPSIVNPELYHETNVTETLRLLEATKHCGVKKFVYAASSSCYGVPATHLPTCEWDPISCEYPYALTKYLGEQYVLHWAKVYKMPAISLRLFNVYGPRSRTRGAYGAVFGVFLSQIANGYPVTIVGDGLQTRDFTYVSDVCEAMLLAAKSDLSETMINIGSGGAHRVDRVADLLDAKERVYIPDRPGEPRQTLASIVRARQWLGYEPKVTIEQGCALMREQLPAYKSAPLWTPEMIADETRDWFTYLGGK